MKLTQIANILNTQIVPNLLGQSVTIAEDLSNIIDIGTALEDLQASDIMDYAQKFAIGVWRTWFDDRAFTKHQDVGLMMDNQEYAGAVQRVRSGLFKSYDSHIVSLERAETPIDYNDGTYYPMDVNVELFTKDVARKVPYSLSTNQIKTYFSSAEAVQMYASLIVTTVDRTISNESYALQLATLSKLAVTQYEAGKKIQLLTQYNSDHGLQSSDDGYVTISNYKNHPEFFHWVAQVIDRLKSRIGNMTNIYTADGTTSFTPESDVKITLLKEFASDNKFANVYAFNRDIVEFEGYNTVDFWQNLGTGLLPSLGVTAEVKETTTEGESTTVSNLVGVIRDKYSAGMTLKADKVSVAYIGAEDFSNFYHHFIMRYFIDRQANAIVLVLE